MSNTEKLLNRVSMLSLIAAGIFFIYEGSILVEMHRDSPSKIPSKVAVAGALTIFLGVLSLGFALVHLFFEGGGSDFFDKMKQGLVATKDSTKNTVKNTTNNAAKAASNTLNNTMNNAARAAARQ